MKEQSSVTRAPSRMRTLPGAVLPGPLLISASMLLLSASVLLALLFLPARAISESRRTARPRCKASSKTPAARASPRPRSPSPMPSRGLASASGYRCARELQLRHASARPLRRHAPRLRAWRREPVAEWSCWWAEFRWCNCAWLRQRPTQTITVSATAVPVETQTGDVSNVVTQQAIQDLPLNGRRFTDLALLSPGRDPGSARPDLRLQWRPVGWRRSRISKQLPGRRHGRQQLFLRAGPRPLSRSLPVQQRGHQGISGLDQLLQRGAGTRGRSRVQRRHQVGHEPMAWQRLLLSARSRLRCRAAVRARTAGRSPAAVRRHARRADPQRPRLLLCRLRSAPADRSFDRAVCQRRQQHRSAARRLRLHGPATGHWPPRSN